MKRCWKLGVFAGCILSLLFSGCTEKQADAGSCDVVDDITVPLLIHTTETEEVFTYYGEWDLSECTVNLGSLLYQSAGASDAKPELWDGEKSLTMYVRDTPTAVEADAVELSLLETEPGDAVILCGPDVTVRYNIFDGAPPEIHYVDEDGSEKICRISDVEISEECGEPFYAGYVADTLYVFYCKYDSASSATIHCLTYSLGDKRGEWTEFEIPEAGSTMDTMYYSVAFIDGKLYLSACYELLALDVTSGEIRKMTDIVNRAKQIIPDSTQVMPAGIEGWITIAGVWEDTVLLYLPLTANDGSDHTLYIAVREETILGAIDITDAGINVYGSNLKSAQTCLQDVSFSKIPVSMPKTH